MMYYIYTLYTWRAANRKCAEVQEFVKQFKNCLIADELSRDALIQEIRHKVEELNAAYPRTKRLIVSFYFNDLISCYHEGRKADEYVFTMYIHTVKKTYKFAEKANVLEEGGKP